MPEPSEANDLDLFSAAFDEAVGGVEDTTVSEPDPPAAPAPAVSESDVAPAPVVSEPSAATEPVADTPAAPVVPAADVPAEPVVLVAPDYAKRTVELLETLAQKATSPAQSPVAPATTAADTSQIPTGDSGAEFLTVEEQALVTEYEKEWPEVSIAEELKTRKMIAEGVQALINQLRIELQPLVQGYQRTSASSHLQEIHEGHADFDIVRPAVETWIEQQPTGLKAVYTKIKDSGSSQDVIELVSLYKQLHGVTPQSSSANPGPTPVKDTKPVKRAAASLAVVDGTRSTVSPKGDGGKDDFDGTWDQITADH